MNEQQKVNKIHEWYDAGKVKVLGHGCYSVPSEAFGLGITPGLVNKVLTNRLIQQNLASAIEGILSTYGDTQQTRLLIANYTLGYLGVSFGLRVSVNDEVRYESR